MSVGVAVRWPDVPERLGLGVGLDLPWGAPSGFQRDPDAGERPTPGVTRYLQAHADVFAYGFFSWQPKNRSRLALDDYREAWDALLRSVPPTWSRRALHQTAFNLGAVGPYDRREVIRFTNQLVSRYGFAWVNEDLGLWSLAGRPLPYPLPPLLTDRGLAAAVAHTAEVQDGLDVPLLVEFPGFDADASLVVGAWHAYDFFREVVVRTGSAATLDTGHLLSYQWLRGRRGEALLAELERLPLAHCFEVHLSGCEIDGDRFVDAHHGVLLEAQLELLDRLLVRCPNLKAITYEDPRFDARGRPVARSRPGLERLRRRVQAWALAAEAA